MAKRRVTTFKLDEEIHSKLQKANLKTVEDVMSHSVLQLMILLRLSYAETEELIVHLSSACVPDLCTAFDLLDLEGRNGVKLGDPHLDEMLQGGVKGGALTEFTGPPGVGKTQLCLHLALSCLRRKSSPNAVCCVDTEGAFRFERLLQMLDADPPRGGVREAAEEEEIASRFHVFQPKTVKDFSAVLESLEMFCIENEIGLVVIDSVASLPRKEFSHNSGLERATVLASWAALFKALADQLKIAVVVTNHVTSKWSEEDSYSSDDDADDGQEVEIPSNEPKNYGARGSHFIGPALGGTWTHFVNTRIILQFSDEDERQLIIAKSPVAPVAVKNYRIGRAGIEFFGEMRFNFDGMNPNRHRITVQPNLLS